VLGPGTLLHEKYRLDCEIGRGGMGSVWRATRLDLGTEVAVKVMHASASEQADALERFSREAKAAARLSSPHVVRVIDFGVDTASQHAYLAMELLVGESLGRRLKLQGKLSASAVAEIIAQVARALNEAHSLGIVHRDLKPANVFLVRNEDQDLVKLLDFGIAKADGSSGDDALLTRTGNVLGTPHYMSPEQLSSSRSVDHRADLWSLAVIACECVTGQRPFRADSLSELAMRIALGRSEPPSSVAPVPVGFDEWFARATQVDPALRFQSAGELAKQLQALAGGRSTEPLPPRAALEPTLLAPGGALAEAAEPTVVAPASAPRTLEDLPLATLSTTQRSSVALSPSATPGAPSPRQRRLPLVLAAGIAAATIAFAVVATRPRTPPAVSVESNRPQTTGTSVTPAATALMGAPPLATGSGGASARAGDSAGAAPSQPAVAPATSAHPPAAGAEPAPAAARPANPAPTRWRRPGRRNDEPGRSRTSVTPREPKTRGGRDHLEAYDWQ
jgi:eukaryotic-like serine/threonine-protein kinase